MCVGERCASEGVGSALYAGFKEKIRVLPRQEGPQRILRSKTTCLGVCQGGPVAVVYPEGVWYDHLNEQKLECILKEHLCGGKPVEPLAFHLNEGSVPDDQKRTKK